MSKTKVLRVVVSLLDDEGAESTATYNPQTGQWGFSSPVYNRYLGLCQEITKACKEADKGVANG